MELREIGPSLPALARQALQTALRGQPFHPPAQGPQAPVFVTLRGRGDQALRGCIGTLAAVCGSVSEETARNAVLAATQDPRFAPVEPEELPRLAIEVSVLLPEQTVDDVSQLDPRRYGVVVRDASGRRGVLLPDVPGVESVDAQLEIARRKAGIAPGRPAVVSRFEVLKFEEA
ncbi:MAG: AmmeMemoRadiSam system protein A [Polyangiaceae bacterium]